MGNYEKKINRKKRSKELSTDELRYLCRVGLRLENLMEQKDVTNTDLAKLLECTEAHIIALKKGKSTMTVVETLRICTHFQISSNELLDLQYIMENSKLIKDTEDKINTQKLQIRISNLTALQRQVLLSLLSPPPE